MSFLARPLPKSDITITVLFGLAILVATLMPGSTLPHPPGTDKLHHFLAFMVFTIPVSLQRPRKAWLIFLIALALGAAIEIVQPYVMRSRDIFDFRADAVGAALGCVIGITIAMLRGFLFKLRTS
jgi:VanZ family protein